MRPGRFLDDYLAAVLGRACLVAALTLAVPAVSLAAPLWCSPFETDGGTAVANGQQAEVVDNSVGAAGLSLGNSDLPLMLFVQYGEAGIPSAPPPAIDPAGLAGNFALSTPEDRRIAIDTNIPSDLAVPADSIDLASALTFEGYFLAPLTGTSDPRISDTDLSRRLITQKRSDVDSSTRISVGLIGLRHGVVIGLNDYDGFDYQDGSVIGPIPISGLNGGIGWSSSTYTAAGWGDGDGDFNMSITNDGISLASPTYPCAVFPYTPVGSRISQTGSNTTLAAPHEVLRLMSHSINLNQEGNVAFFSFLMRKVGTAETANEQMEVDLTADNSTSRIIHLGIWHDESFYIATNTTGALGGTTTVPNSKTAADVVQAGVTYFVVAKIVSHVGSDDEVYLSYYAPEDTLPALNPVTHEPEVASWKLAATINSTSNLARLRIETGTAVVGAEFDEIRVGPTYASVTDPSVGTSDPGVVDTTVLAVQWRDADAIDHVVAGSTPIEANTWYHFALTWDGTTLRGYLNGHGPEISPGVYAPEEITAATTLIPPGIGKITLANLRVGGTTLDRNFYGLLDELRIWGRALPVSEMAVDGGGAGPQLVWRSRFETSHGVPVTNGQEASTINCIDNSVGPPNGTPAGIKGNLYAQYGVSGLTAIPSSLDPADLAGSFAISLLDFLNVAVNTNVPSNSGNIADALTIQGYFNSSRTGVAGVNALSNRFVTTMRAGTPGQQGASRLAIGLAPNDDVAPTFNVVGIIWFDAANVGHEVKGTTPIMAGDWHHFALVWDGTDVTWYLDGNVEGQVLAADLAAAGGLAPPGDGPIILGNDRATGDGTRAFFGLLDQVVIRDEVVPPAKFMIAGIDACGAAICNRPFADFDEDGDVDQSDFGAYQLCYTGPDQDATGQCLCFDRSQDHHVDAADLTAFMNCFTGPTVPWTSASIPDCLP